MRHNFNHAHNSNVWPFKVSYKSCVTNSTTHQDGFHRGRRSAWIVSCRRSSGIFLLACQPACKAIGVVAMLVPGLQPPPMPIGARSLSGVLEKARHVACLRLLTRHSSTCSHQTTPCKRRTERLELGVFVSQEPRQASGNMAHISELNHKHRQNTCHCTLVLLNTFTPLKAAYKF